MFIACIGIVIGIIRFSNPNLWGLVLEFLAAKNPAPKKKIPQVCHDAVKPYIFWHFPREATRNGWVRLANPRKNG